MDRRSLKKAIEIVEVTRTSIVDDGTSIENVGYDLGNGLAGRLLFMLQAQRYFPRDDCAKYIAACSVELAIHLRNLKQHGLFNGLEGVLWALYGSGIPIVEKALLKKQSLYPKLVRNHISHASPSGFDLITGLVGVGLFNLFRSGPQSSETQVAVDALISRAIKCPNGTFWKTTKSDLRLVPIGREERETWNDLGLAHGTPGVLVFLCLFVRATQSRNLEGVISAVVSWIRSNEQSEHITRFPFMASEPKVSRLAWCYGDLAVALSLVIASQTLGDNETFEFAIDTAKHAFSSEALITAVGDNSLCHGTSGLALLADSFCRLSGNSFFERKKNEWLYRAINSGRNPEVHNGLLEGSAGLSTALLELVFGQPSTTRKILLIS